MKITCLGAARCVTGSCFLLDNGKKYLVDCGLFQGGKAMETLNQQPWGFNPAEISALFLTHAHIDHSGRIPKLVKDGFKGKIYTSLPTAELCKILLLDAAHIQEMEAEWQTRKNRRRGSVDVQPLYTVADAEASLPLIHVVQRDETISVDSGLRLCFRNSGHILGASILEIWIGGSGEPAHKIVFTGDIGHKGQLIVQDPYPVAAADTLFIESTYGNRNHKSFEESKRELLEAIHYSYQYGEKVIIPAFAVARTQELLYIIGEFFRKGLIPSMPVFLDSPLAIAATEIFRRMRQFYDEEALDIVNNGHDPLHFSQLVLSRTAEESVALNHTEGPGIIIAGNGMCTAGRILHHLKHNVWRRGCSLVIVGYQAAGSIGRKIVDGAKSLKILGENLAVRARVFTIGGFSAHGGQKDLLEWLGHFTNPRMQVYVVHGEESVCYEFATRVRQRFGFETHVPGIGTMVELAGTQREAAGEGSLQERLAGIIRRTEQLRTLLETPDADLPPQLMAQLEQELSRTEKTIEAFLREARKA